MIDIERHSQSPFIIFQGQREHADDAVRAVQDHIESHFGEPTTVEQLAAQVALERRRLERRCRKATGNSVVEYVQRVRVDAAKKRLEIRNVFKKTTSMTPAEYRSKYKIYALVTA